MPISMSPGSPARISLSGIDRAFLTPESQTGRYFPRSLVVDLNLRRPVSADQIVDALVRLSGEQSALRLAYRLDTAHGCWTRLPETNWHDHWQSCVHSGPMPEMGALLADNNDPINDPVHVFVDETHLRLRVPHVFGDATALKITFAYWLNAVFDADHILPPLGSESGLNVAQFIGRSAFGWRGVLLAMFGTLRTSQPAATSQPRQPVQVMYSQVPQAVVRFTFPESTLTAVKQLRRELKANFTVILQALIGYRLRQLGCLSGAHPYTVPIDLRQYLPPGFYPGNLLSFIQLVADGANFHEEVHALQTAFDQAQKRHMAVALLPLSCVAMGMGGRLYDRLNAAYLEKQPGRDPRLFILSNFGNMPIYGDKVTAALDLQSGAGFAVPLMEGPGLMLAFYIMEGRPSLTVTYDPLRWNAEQVQSIADIFHELPNATD